MRELGFVKAISGLEDAAFLDPVVGRAKGLVDAVLRPRALRDLLHGVPAGHPVHPVAVMVPIGSWLSAAALDAVPGSERASELLIALGVVSAAPASVMGWADWSQLHPQQQRVGIVHAASNATAVALYAASFVQRRRGRTLSGKAFGYLGLIVVSAGGYLGGHLSYRQAAGVNHAEEVPHLFPEGWQALGALADLPDGELTRREVAGQPLLVLRSGDGVDVLSNTCSHLAAPLDEGELSVDAKGGACVTCPWHQSVFALKTGDVIHGPATAPQPRFETRVTAGRVEIALPGAG